MLVKSRAVVLYTLKYSDDAVIVETFTELQGRVSFLVRLSRSRRAMVRPVLLQPLSLLELEWSRSDRASLSKIKNARAWLPLASIPYDPYKSAIAMFLAEFLHYALREETDARYLFEFIARSVEWLDTAQRDFSNFHLVFLLRLTRFLGFYPNLDDAHEGCWFDMLNSCFVSTRPLHGHALPPEDARRLPLLMRMRFATMRLFRFSGQERNRLLALLNDYYRLHLPSFPELKSLAVLRDLFS